MSEYVIMTKATRNHVAILYLSGGLLLMCAGMAAVIGGASGLTLALVSALAAIGFQYRAAWILDRAPTITVQGAFGDCPKDGGP